MNLNNTISKQKSDKPKKNTKKAVALSIVGVIALMTAVNSFAIIPAGHRGVLMTMGAVEDKVMKEGFNIKAPFFQSVEEMEVRVQKMEAETTASTKDLQNVVTHIVVNFELNPNAVNIVYQEVGFDYEQRIITPAVAESLKAVTAKYKSDELISKREEVSQMVKEALGKKMEKYNILLTDINIKDFTFSKNFNDSIEQKQIAEQKYLKAQRDLERIEIEAQQKVETAKAEAKSLELKKQSVTEDLVRLKEIEVKERMLEVQEKAIDKWDGKMPNVTGGAVPFINAELTSTTQN
ncbi:prohibitin family protein [Bacillus sp. M6-12]|uniref:prohibitin family protein n=1 Tax=Bacillus sp. M6-12 TaxID=2054166 RepID=UPI002155D9B1|nr:prohibitin family protein [Bacillus sp. M6-12]